MATRLTPLASRSGLMEASTLADFLHNTHPKCLRRARTIISFLNVSFNIIGCSSTFAKGRLNSWFRIFILSSPSFFSSLPSAEVSIIADEDKASFPSSSSCAACSVAKAAIQEIHASSFFHISSSLSLSSKVLSFALQITVTQEFLAVSLSALRVQLVNRQAS